jgi:hypothetical protein
VTVHELSRADARRVAVRAQLLDHERPTGSNWISSHPVGRSEGLCRRLELLAGTDGGGPDL